MKKVLSVLLAVLLAVSVDAGDAFAKGGSSSSSSSSSSRRSPARSSRQNRQNSQAVQNGSERRSQDGEEASAEGFAGEGEGENAEGAAGERQGAADGRQGAAEPVPETSDDKLWQGVLKENFMDVKDALDAGAYPNLKKDGVYVLEQALKKGNETIVLYLLEKGADGNLADRQGRNMLYTAFEKMNTEGIISALLQRGISVNSKDFNEVPMFFYAFSVSKKDEIISLMTNNAEPDFNLTDGQSNSVLHFLIKNNLPSRFIDFMLMKKVNVNLRDKNGDTPLMLALRKGDSILVEKLVDAGADVNIENEAGVTPLNYALVSVKDPDLLEKLITRKINVNMQDKQGNTPLMFVLKTSRDPTAVELLLDAGADVNIKDNNGDTPLMYLMRVIRTNDFLDSDYFAELLLEFGAKVNERDAQGKTPLMNLILSKRVAVLDDVALVKKFIDADADLDIEDFEGNTVLLMATRETSSAPLVNMLIMGGADVKKMDVSSKTPLDYAQNNLRLSLKDGYDDIMKKLTTNTESLRAKFYKFLKIGNLSDIQEFIAQGADVNAVDENGDTPLMRTIVYSRPMEMIEYLISQGANVNAANKEGDTPLMKAFIHKRDLEAVNLLLAHGADVNAKNAKGDTPLRRALMFSKNPAVIEALMKAGADVNAEDNLGTTIWDYAEKNPEIKERETYVKLLELTE